MTDDKDNRTTARPLAEIVAERDNGNAGETGSATTTGGTSQAVTEDNITQAGPDDKKPLNDDGTANLEDDIVDDKPEQEPPPPPPSQESMDADAAAAEFSQPKPLIPVDSYRVEPDGYVGPAHNADGYRNVVANTRGQLTVLDDDSAKMFFEQPTFYHYVYDDGSKDSAHVSMLSWADPEGRTYGAIGQTYPIGE